MNLKEYFRIKHIIKLENRITKYDRYIQKVKFWIDKDQKELKQLRKCQN